MYVQVHVSDYLSCHRLMAEHLYVDCNFQICANLMHVHLHDLSVYILVFSMIGYFQQEHGLHLPSSVFGSTTETDVGMLNKAAPISGT